MSTSSVAYIYYSTIRLFVLACFLSQASKAPAWLVFFLACEEREGFPGGRERVCAAERFSVWWWCPCVAQREPCLVVPHESVVHIRVVGCFPCLPLQERIYPSCRQSAHASCTAHLKLSLGG